MPRFVLCWAIGLLAALFLGCHEEGVQKAAKGPQPAAPESSDRGGEIWFSTPDGRGEAAPARSMTKSKNKEGKAGERKEAVAPRKPLMDEARVGTGKPIRDRTEAQVPANVLTAGSFDDNLFPQYFRSFAGKVGQNSYLGDLPGKLLGQRLEVRVRNGRGAPVGNARVRIGVVAGRRPVELTTRSDGRAIFVSSWDQFGEEGEVDVSAALAGATEWVSRRVPRDATDCTVILPTADAPLPASLDLAIVLDTTGSMGDELRYLKAEVRSITSAVRQQFPQVSQRYALVLYRDQGDEYVTRVFDFTSSIDEFHKNLAAQSAGGGGDLPEAMHKGLEAATGLRWSNGDTARVLFLVGDAPPHAQDGLATLEAVNGLRQKGVAIYPLAGSCNDPTATEALEFFFRAAALLTGAQYLFLTDDSGVGDSHGEPRIPFYHVEKLNRLIIRMISAELGGRHTDPEPQDIVRTVGKPPRSGRQD